MKCMKQTDVVDYMLSLDLEDFIEEQIVVKTKQYMYTSKIRVTHDRTMIRCRPIQQARRGGLVPYDSRTIYAPIYSNNGRYSITPQIISYFAVVAAETHRINSRQTNEANVPQSVGVDIENLTTLNFTGWELGSINENE